MYNIHADVLYIVWYYRCMFRLVIFSVYFTRLNDHSSLYILHGTIYNIVYDNIMT